MSNKSNSSKNSDGVADGRVRYEFRVWGSHRKARKMLERMASEVIEETYQDCYLLSDDSTWNAKVRDNTLKIKQLVDQKKGFEQWVSGRYHTSDDTPSPFDDLFEELRLDRPQRGKKYNLPKEVRKLDANEDFQAVFVTKHRRRYTVGEVLAEVTDIEIDGSGDTLRTLSIQGDDLKELKRLRKQLGVRDEPNIAMHEVIESQISACG